MKSVEFNPATDLVFDLKVVEACRNCKRFGSKASCPPYVFETHYYQKLLPTYKHGIIFYEAFPVITSEWKKLGQTSSLKIQKTVLAKREELFNTGHYFVTAFGSGSCKICPECQFPCRFPQKSLVPLEATGIDVVRMMEKVGVSLKFPVKKIFYRIGVVLYD